MTTGNPLEQYELTPEGRRRIGWLAAAVAIILAVAAGGWGWSAQRRAGTAEQALAAVAAERDAATAAAGQRQEMLAQAEAAAKAGDARVVELEQQIQALDSLLQGANADVTRLRSELAARDAAPTVAVEANDGSGAVTGSLGTTETATLAPVEPPAPAAPGAEPETPALAAVEPAAAPAAPEIEPETLAIVFDVNSSYLPASLDGRLRELAAKLEPGRAYEIALVGAVGNGDVEGKSAEEALRYNRWMAERRVSRVAEFLENNAKAGKLTIRQDFALNDQSRQVLVEIRPLSD